MSRVLRLFQQNDIPAVARLYRQLFEHVAELEPAYLQASEQDEKFLLQVCNGENGFVGYVAEVNGTIAGFAIAQQQASPPYACFRPLKSVYLMDMGVEQAFRGQGIGASLIAAVKAWASEQKADYLELTVHDANFKAARLYQREGFAPYSTSMRMWLGPS